MTLATKLTLIRILFVPVFIVVFYLQYAWNLMSFGYILAAVIFFIASITDVLDGHFARKMNQVSEMGKLLDPIADKLLICSAILLLVEWHKVAAWVAIIIIGREFIISGLRMISASKGNIIAARGLGKAKTTLQTIAVIMILLQDWPFSYFNWIKNMQVGGQPLTIGTIILYVSVVLSIISLVEYIILNKHVFLADRDKKEAVK